MLKTQEKVYKFMKAMELPLPNEDGPGVSGLHFDLMRNLVEEEAQEFIDAMIFLEQAIQDQDRERIMTWWAEVIDAICDINVVIHNASNAMHIDIEPFLDEVHRSNMAKVGGEVRADGKRLKPKGWKPPNIRGMLEALVSDDPLDDVDTVDTTLKYQDQ